MSKSVYKYRSGDENTFERDLASLERNTFYAPCSEKLNDPCETLVFRDHCDIQVGFINRIFNVGANVDIRRLNLAYYNLLSRKNKIGIYALSQTYSDELLWAHYANSHYGFCIEYDLEKLLEVYSSKKLYHFPMKYSRFPPQLSLSLAISGDLLKVIKNLSGVKSKRWKYEKEYRIVIDNSGYQFYDHKALKAIYFGLRMSKDYKDEVMRRLKGRALKFYQMKQATKSYHFEAELIDGGDEETYLRQIPKSVSGKDNVNFAIENKHFEWELKKGTIQIILDQRVNEKSLFWIANQIKDQVFFGSEMVFMFYKISGEENREICWATSHYQEGIIKVNINE